MNIVSIQNNKRSINLLSRACSILAVLALAFVFLSPNIAYSQDEPTVENVRQAAELRNVVGELKYLDEVLTSSILSYLYTHDEKWLDRYIENQPKLALAFSQVMSFGTDLDREETAKIIKANEARIRLEYQAIELAGQGKWLEAQEITNSPDYSNFKAECANALAQFLENVELRSKTALLASKTPSSVQLTAEESQWIKGNPVIQVHNESDWPPFNFAENGQAKGYSIDFMDMAAERVGLKVRYITGPSWNEFLDMMKSGDLDVMLNIVKTPQRQEYLLYTPPYANNPNTILSRKDTPYNNLEELFGKTISVPKGFFYEKILLDEYPQIKVLALKNTVETMNAVNIGKADAALGELAVFSHLLATNMMSDLKVSGIVNMGNPELALLNMATRKDRPLLASILTKAIQSVKIEDKRAIQQKWMGLLPVDAASGSTLEDDALSKDVLFFFGAAVIAIIIFLLFFIWLAKTQRRPFLQSLSGKSIFFIFGVFLLVGVSMVWALSLVGDQISTRLGSFVAQRHVLWHKEKVLGAVQRELALTKQMASSETLIRWGEDEDNPSITADAKNELQHYHDNFKARTFFVGLKKSGHFFYSDEKVKHIELAVVDTLSPTDEDDAWFFSTLKDKAPYNLNVDHNVQLGVTKLWVNYALRSQGRTYGVVGTGINLTEFIKDHVELDTKGIAALMIDDRGDFRAHSDKTKIAHNVAATGEGQARAGKNIWALLSSEQDHKSLQDNMDRLKGGDAGAATFFLNIEGVRSLVAISYLEPLGWYTLAVFEPDKMIGFKEKATLLVILSISLTLSVLVFLIGQNFMIIGPLRELASGANKVASGDYDVQLPVRQLDEIGDLSQNFNAMASTISDYTRNLQGKVEERTQELATKQAQLQIAMDNMPGGMFMVDEDQTFVLANHRYTELFEFPEGLMSEGKALADMISFQSERGDYGDQNIEAAVDHAKQLYFDGQHHLYDRQLTNGRIMEVSLGPIPGGGTVVVASDITDRKKAEVELNAAHQGLGEAMDHIQGSINYATHIQHSILPPQKSLEDATREHFVLWEPRDRVGGDIYWCKPWGLGKVLALGDCTGHGVPGAFMTLIANGSLDMAIMETMPGDVSALLQRTHQIIQEALGQNGGDGTSDDGLELGICFLTPGSNTLTFAGARFSLFHKTGEEIVEIKGDKTGIAYSGVAHDVVFSSHSLEAADGSCFYMTSDGLIDQIGGAKQRGFGKKRFRKLLVELDTLPMSERGKSILSALEDYQGSQKRRDDVSVIGFTL